MIRYRKWTLSQWSPCLPLFLLALTFLPIEARANDDLWQKLQGGEHAALLRHAVAPGTGDPANFDVEDCETQRNLSASGREQAARIGERFKANGIYATDVYSSQWCRCLDTAALLGLGDVEPLPILNSFFGRYERRDQQTEALTAWLQEAERDRPTVLVTHQVNISALTDVFPASGELVIVHITEDGEISVAGTIETD